MADHKEMYLILSRACGKAIDLLIQAQQECEELYLSAPEPQLKLLTPAAPPLGHLEKEPPL